MQPRGSLRIRAKGAALRNGCLLELLLDFADRLAGTVAELLRHLRALQGGLALGRRCTGRGRH